MFCGGQNGVSEPQQAFYNLCGSENGLSVQTFHRHFDTQNLLSDLLEELYTICSGEIRLCEALQASYTFSCG